MVKLQFMNFPTSLQKDYEKRNKTSSSNSYVKYSRTENKQSIAQAPINESPERTEEQLNKDVEQAKQNKILEFLSLSLGNKIRYFANINRDDKINLLDIKQDQIKQIEQLKTGTAIIKESGDIAQDNASTNWFEQLFNRQSEQELKYQELLQQNISLSMGLDELSKRENIIIQARDSGLSEGQINEIITPTTSSSSFDFGSLVKTGGVILIGAIILNSILKNKGK